MIRDIATDLVHLAISCHFIPYDIFNQEIEEHLNQLRIVSNRDDYFRSDKHF